MLTADRLAHLPAAPRRWHVALAAAGAAGLGFAVGALVQVAAALAAVGGACAAGGPYVIETPCPSGVLAYGSTAIPLGMVSGALLAWGAATVRRGTGVLALLGWPALFGALGVRGVVDGAALQAVLFLVLAAPAWCLRRPVGRAIRSAPRLSAALLAAAATGAAAATILVGT